MKKKQISAASIAAIVILLVFSGCDAVLEVFYPEFAYGKGDVSVISIWAQIDMYPGELSGSSQYIAGRVIDMDSSEVVRELGVEPRWNWIEEKNLIYWRLEGNLDFSGIEDGEYEIMVWLEQNGDGNPYGANEPYIYATNNADGSTTFFVPGDQSSDGWLFGEARVPL